MNRSGHLRTPSPHPAPSLRGLVLLTVISILPL